MEYDSYQYAEWKPDFWVIEDGHVRMFLLIGQQDALLIDSGFGNGDLPGLLKKITDLPVRVLLTHCDGDHTGGLKYFTEVICHPAEFAPLVASGVTHLTLKPVWQNEEVQCGRFSLNVVHIPGHTPGSIALYDEANHFMIPGDSIQEGPIFMMGANRNMPAQVASLEKLTLMYLDEVEELIPSHNAYPLDREYVWYALDSAKEILAGTAQVDDAPAQFEGKCKLYTAAGVQYYY